METKNPAYPVTYPVTKIPYSRSSLMHQNRSDGQIYGAELSDMGARNMTHGRHKKLLVFFLCFSIL